MTKKKQLTEQEELEELAVKKQKIELKYGKKAKKQLTQISKIISPSKLIIDMTDDEFKMFLNTLQQEITWINNAQQQQQVQRNNQQQNYRTN